MIKPYTKPVITDPYYDKPSWIENDVQRKEFIILSGDSNDEDVELFLILLFGYRDIDVNLSFEESFHELFKEEQVAVSGGIGFFAGQEKRILPGCCCGLEQLIDVCESISNRKSPWLGHDPSPGITYHGNRVKVWADDLEEETVSEDEVIESLIEYEYVELLASLENTKADLEAFINGPLHRWISKRSHTVADKMKDRMKTWFLFGIVNKKL